jgi:hypothetical protein
MQTAEPDCIDFRFDLPTNTVKVTLGPSKAREDVVAREAAEKLIQLRRHIVSEAQGKPLNEPQVESLLATPGKVHNSPLKVSGEMPPVVASLLTETLSSVVGALMFEIAEGTYIVTANRGSGHKIGDLVQA